MKKFLDIKSYTEYQLYAQDRDIVIKNYLILQKIINEQAKLIDLYKQRFEKTRKMINGIFQRKIDKDKSNV